MQNFKYLIIGGGIAGTTAAETIRQNDPAGSIAIVNDEPYRLYSRVMLSKPNFFLEKTPFDQVWLKTELWYEEKNITLLGGKTAIAVDVENKHVSLNDESQIGYEKLLLATGAKARRWTVDGAWKKGVYYLRTLDHSKAVISAAKLAKKAIAIGSGFISFEMVKLLKESNLDTTVVMRENYYWETLLDETSGKMVEKALVDSDIKIKRNSEVQKVLGDDRVVGVLLKDGQKIDCDIIICGIGVVHPKEWLEESGININRGIITNEYMETNIDNIWAAGDAAEYKDIILDETVQLCNWMSAREHGRIAGLNMAGKKEMFEFVSFYNTQGLGMNITVVGDIRPKTDSIIIKRGSPEMNSYCHLVIVGKELVGATLINRAKETIIVAKLIKNNIDVSQKEEELADPNFDLKSLL